ncbi:hypothetical protein CRENBAI_003586 [Crenichthys baileyi]|uniref:Secreted protein n=1 Tax=Crenichthys baileyi TaxID=28760 RepID=A0AAV9SLQ9_9TELE
MYVCVGVWVCVCVCVCLTAAPRLTVEKCPHLAAHLSGKLVHTDTDKHSHNRSVFKVTQTLESQIDIYVIKLTICTVYMPVRSMWTSYLNLSSVKDRVRSNKLVQPFESDSVSDQTLP